MPETVDLEDSGSSSSNEKKIFEAIANDDPVLLKALLTENPQNVNIFDLDKVTPLQHAAFKGSKELVQILLDQGADAKICEHIHNYTALHFGALSGNTDVCLLLLNAGSKSTETNSVGRTPSQMAAFVGHYDCVSIINNFVPKSEIECYTENVDNTNNSTATAAQLPLFLAESFHKFIMQINIHPVKVVMNLYNIVGLQDHLAELKKVLELMSEKEMKKGPETNEIMSFKFHYLGYIVGEVHKLKHRQNNVKETSASAADEDRNNKAPGDVTETFARKLLKPGKDDSLEFMDAFIKECIREFPFRESALFRQIVTTLSSAEKSPSALYVVNSFINGQRGFLDCLAHCNTCGEEKPAKKCSKCKAVQYCDRNCQRLHWTWHKKACARLIQDCTNITGGETEPTIPNKEVDIKELQNFLVKN